MTSPTFKPWREYFLQLGHESARHSRQHAIIFRLYNRTLQALIGMNDCVCRGLSMRGWSWTDVTATSE